MGALHARLGKLARRGIKRTKIESWPRRDQLCRWPDCIPLVAAKVNNSGLFRHPPFAGFPWPRHAVEWEREGQYHPGGSRLGLTFEWDEVKAGEHIRIISCRSATHSERKAYEESGR